MYLLRTSAAPAASASVFDCLERVLRGRLDTCMAGLLPCKALHGNRLPRKAAYSMYLCLIVVYGCVDYLRKAASCVFFICWPVIVPTIQSALSRTYLFEEVCLVLRASSGKCAHGSLAPSCGP